MDNGDMTISNLKKKWTNTKIDLDQYKKYYEQLKNKNWKYESGFESEIRGRVNKIEETLSRIEEFLNKFFDTKIGDKDG